MAKFCTCGAATCPICKGKASGEEPFRSTDLTLNRPLFSRAAINLLEKRKRTPSVRIPIPQNASVPVPPTVESRPNVTVPPENPSVRIAKLDRLTASTTEEIMAGIHHVPCGCGCGKMVKVGPVYASSACRSRAWRKKRAE